MGSDLSFVYQKFRKLEFDLGAEGEEVGVWGRRDNVMPSLSVLSIEFKIYMILALHNYI